MTLLEYLTEELTNGRMTQQQVRTVALLAYDKNKNQEAKRVLAESGSAAEACVRLGVSRATLYRRVAAGGS